MIENMMIIIIIAAIAVGVVWYYTKPMDESGDDDFGY
jgi:hypothetical protein